MCCCPCFGTLALAAIAALAFYKFFCCKSCCKKKPELLEKNYEKDKVYLYQFNRSANIPNISPYCLKVESFLRLNKIDYESRYSLKARSKYGLLPFIELNGEQIADSQLIEEALKKHFNIKSNLSEYDESVGRATARFVASHTSHIVGKYRYVDEAEKMVESYFELAGYPNFLKPLGVCFIRLKATKALRRNVGPFSDSEFDMLLKKDLDALKGILGEKQFFMGDTISNVDASIFGHIATWYYTKGHISRVLDRDYASIVEWLERVKTELFPNDFTQ